MADYFEYYPVDGGILITFGNNSDYILRSFEGTGSNLVSPQSQKAPYQIGVSYLNPDINPRIVSINIRFTCNDLTNINTLKNNLAKKLVAEPKRDRGKAELGLLRYYRQGLEPLELQAVAIDSPQFSQVSIRGNVYDADIEFFCPYPFWREINDEFKRFESEGGLVFPFEFPFEIESYDLKTEIDNQGDISVPFKLVVYGEIDTFRIINNTTNKTLEVTGFISDTEKVEVDTTFGDKSVILIDSLGNETNIFNRVTIDNSDFWQLEKGINEILFETNENNGGYAVLYWRENYAGI